MALPLALLEGVGRSALPLLGELSALQIGSAIASNVWKWWSKRKEAKERRAELETLIGAVTRDHRLTTQTLPYRKLAQLRRAGVLVSTNRGIYARLIAFTSQTRLRPIRIGGTRGTT